MSQEEAEPPRREAKLGEEAVFYSPSSPDPGRTQQTLCVFPGSFKQQPDGVIDAREVKMNARSCDLAFDNTGHPLVGDENEPEYGELGLANLDWEDVTPPCRQEFRAIRRESAGYIALEDIYSEMSLAYEGRTEEDEDAEELLALCEQGLVHEAEQWARTAEDLRDLSRSVLCTQYDFTPSQLLDEEGRALNREVLAVVHAACEAARQLGRTEACRILGVEIMGRRSMASIGWKRFFNSSAALQAAVEKKDAPTPRPKPTTTSATKRRPTILLGVRINP